MNQTPAAQLLTRLEKVRQTRPNNWVACCPAHPDRDPSLAIQEKDDGALLVHCRAGCCTNDVMTAVGLKLSDLFPPSDPAERIRYGQMRERIKAQKELAFEKLVVDLAKSDKFPLTEADQRRLNKAHLRIAKFKAAGYE